MYGGQRGEDIKTCYQNIGASCIAKYHELDDACSYYVNEIAVR